MSSFLLSLPSFWVCVLRTCYYFYWLRIFIRFSGIYYVIYITVSRCRFAYTFLFYFIFWLCEEKVCKFNFGAYLFNSMGYTCHVGDYYSKILVFDWSRRERMRDGRIYFFVVVIWRRVYFFLLSLIPFCFASFFFCVCISSSSWNFTIHCDSFKSM